MKNLKIYKKAIAVLTAGTLVLFSGCTAKSNNSETDTQQESKNCIHLTVYFEDQPITFKECEGYEIASNLTADTGYIRYTISIDGVEVISGGRASEFNRYIVNHDVVDENFDNEVLKKSK